MAFAPTHVVPATAGGIATWPSPDSTAPAGPRLNAGLAVVVVTSRDDGWAQIECENAWRAWVDGRLLLPVGATAATAATDYRSMFNQATASDAPASDATTQQPQPLEQPTGAGFSFTPHAGGAIADRGSAASCRG